MNMAKIEAEMERVKSERPEYVKNVEESTLETIEAHAVYGRPPGGFVTSVLCNNLFEAMFRADDNNRENMLYILQYIYNSDNIPGLCWGSIERVAEWRRIKREEKEDNA
jgi:hypothetical protein